MFGKNKKYTLGFTDEELKMIAMSSASLFIRKNTWNLQECMDAEFAAIKQAYADRHHGRKLRPFKPEELSCITEAFERLKGELTEMTQKRLRSVKKSQAVQTISETTAKSILSGILDETGLKYSMVCQKYRIKVIIELERKSIVQLYIHYKDIIGKDLTPLAPSLQTLNDIVSPLNLAHKQKMNQI